MGPWSMMAGLPGAGGSSELSQLLEQLKLLLLLLLKIGGGGVGRCRGDLWSHSLILRGLTTAGGGGGGATASEKVEYVAASSLSESSVLVGCIKRLLRCMEPS